MNKLRDIIFMIFGIIGIINQLFGIYIILTLIGYITNCWLLVILLAVLITIIDFWKANYFKRLGRKATFRDWLKK